MFGLLKKWLRNSSRVHVRGNPVSTGRDLVVLIDKFVDDKLAYPLEWDDFVSWKNMDAGIESVRLRIEDLEPLFFSSSMTDRNRATQELINIRNDIASSHGIERRLPPQD